MRKGMGAAILLLVAGCSAVENVGDVVIPKSPLVLTANVADQAKGVTVDTLVRVDSEGGVLASGGLVDAAGEKVPGQIVDGAWEAGERLEPATTYTLTAQGTGEDGKAVALTHTFTTHALDLKHQTYPSVAPLKGETVGVGMPVMVFFDIAVKDRALYEQNMHVTSEPAVEGAWSWLSDREVHWRPKEYWPAGTKVSVDLDTNGLPAGNGIYGQQDQDIDFRIGSRNVSVVDIAAHTLKFTRDGKTLRTIPVSTGDSSHQTREGVKVIMEKFSSIRMDAATTGVDSDAPDYYNIDGVRWAMRVTDTGEFIHAAPWSVGSQGRANVSHGCTGMSTDNAGWLYQQSRRGDVVEYVNSSRPLDAGNGWTDWNVSWDDWLDGSALPDATVSPSVSATASPAAL